MKEKPEERRGPSPVPLTHDRRSRKRARGAEEELFPHAPTAPDGISGNWE